MDNKSDLKAKIKAFKEEWVESVFEEKLKTETPYVLPSQIRERLLQISESLAGELVFKWNEAKKTLFACLKEFTSKQPELFSDKLLEALDEVSRSADVLPFSKSDEERENSLRQRLCVPDELMSALFNIGKILLEEKRFKEGSDIFFLLAQLDGEEPSYCESLGNALYYDGKKEEAKQAYLSCILINPTDPEPFYSLAYLQQEENNFFQAEASLNEGKRAATLLNNEAFLKKAEKLSLFIEGKKLRSNL